MTTTFSEQGDIIILDFESHSGHEMGRDTRLTNRDALPWLYRTLNTIG